MTNTTFLDVYEVNTLINCKEIEHLAVRIWAYSLIQKPKQTAHYFDEAYDYNANSKSPNGTIYKWLKYGRPIPNLKKTAGKKGLLHRILIDHPHSLRVLYSPGWVLLSGPVSSSALDSLMQHIDWKVYQILNKHLLSRSLIEAGDPEQLVRIANVKRYIAHFLGQLTRIGTLEAFFGMVFLVCEFGLMRNYLPEENAVFNFVPKKWKFCQGLPDDLILELGERINILAQAYYSHHNVSISIVRVHRKIFEKSKLPRKSEEGDELFRLLIKGLT